MDKDADKSNETSLSLSRQILDQIPTPVMGVDREMKIIYMNHAGLDMLGKDWETIRGKKCHEELKSTHCNTPNCCLKKAIAEDRTFSARTEISVPGNKIPVEYFAAPLKNEDGVIIGGLEYLVDISERLRYEERLKEQARTIREISTPAIKLWDGIVVLPVVGIVDSARAQQMMDAILLKITETSSRVIILDIQGVAAVDTAVANHLIKIIRATRLMGNQCIISGISPAVAQTIVNLGIDMTGILTNCTLKDALADAFKLINLDVRQIRYAERRV